MKLAEPWKATLISLGFTILFLHNFIFNLGNPIGLSHGDAFHVTFTLNHYMTIFTTGSFKNILNMPFFYGFDNTLLYSEILLVQALMCLPIYLLTHNIIFTFNLVCVTTIFLDFLGMFLLVKYLTKQIAPAILGSIIYTFNPWVFGHFPDELMHYSIAWIPLALLYFEKSLKNPSRKNLFLFFLFLVLQLFSNVSYSGLLTIILPIYCGIRIYQTKLNLKKFINAGSVFGLILFILATSTLGYFYINFSFKNSINRSSIADLGYFSPWISDLFLAGQTNLVYGGLRGWASQNMPEIVSNIVDVERNLFWGIVPIILFILSFKFLNKSNYKRLWLVLVGLLIFCQILSLGPEIRFGQNLSIPGLYGLLYAIHPLIRQLRVASRFEIFVFLFLGIICAFVLAEIQRKYPKKAKFVSVLIVCLLVLEYYHLPWDFAQIPPETQKFYQILNKQSDIKVIAEFPMGNFTTPATLATDQFVDSKYMLYATLYHSKILLNGYSSYLPPEYEKRVEYLTLNFPIKSKLNQLKKWGVNGVILHREEFADPRNFDLIKARMNELNVPIITENNELILFDINKI